MFPKIKKYPKFKLGDLVLFAGFKSEVKGVKEVPIATEIFYFYELYNYTTFVFFTRH